MIQGYRKSYSVIPPQQAYVLTNCSRQIVQDAVEGARPSAPRGAWLRPVDADDAIQLLAARRRAFRSAGKPWVDAVAASASDRRRGFVQRFHGPKDA